MSRRLDADHERLFAVFAGDEAAAAEAHREFTSWLASNKLSGSLRWSSTAPAVSGFRFLSPATSPEAEAEVEVSSPAAASASSGSEGSSAPSPAIADLADLADLEGRASSAAAWLKAESAAPSAEKSTAAEAPPVGDTEATRKA